MRTYFFVSIIAFFALQGCIVSKKKYDDMLAQKVKSEGELAQANERLAQASTDISSLNEQVTALKIDTTDLNQNLRATAQRLDELSQEYEQLQTFYKNLLNSSGKLNRDLTMQKEQLLAIQENLEKTRKLNDSLSENLIQRERKVVELEQVLASKDKAAQDLKNRISKALLNFKENDLTVNVKNGKVYVSLAEQLLFNSGSVEVDSKGVSALQQLAVAIRDQKDIHIMVEGHTDNVPISKKSTYMQDNWDLSVMRATSISRILIKAGVSPGQITAAGKGEYSPLAPNNTPENRQKNRRTEIIITPNLDELFQLLEPN